MPVMLLSNYWFTATHSRRSSSTRAQPPHIEKHTLYACIPRTLPPMIPPTSKHSCINMASPYKTIFIRISVVY
jgi:hypothetical protein